MSAGLEASTVTPGGTRQLCPAPRRRCSIVRRPRGGRSRSARPSTVLLTSSSRVLCGVGADALPRNHARFTALTLGRRKIYGHAEEGRKETEDELLAGKF